MTFQITNSPLTDATRTLVQSQLQLLQRVSSEDSPEAAARELAEAWGPPIWNLISRIIHALLMVVGLSINLATKFVRTPSVRIQLGRAAAFITAQLQVVLCAIRRTWQPDLHEQPAPSDEHKPTPLNEQPDTSETTVLTEQPDSAEAQPEDALDADHAGNAEAGAPEGAAAAVESPLPHAPLKPRYRQRARGIAS